MYDMTLTEIEVVEGGNPVAIAALAFTGYTVLLDKIEKNPSSYTWMMDWYYS